MSGHTGHNLGREVLLASSGCCKTPHSAQDSPSQQRSICSQVLVEPRLKNPALEDSKGLNSLSTPLAERQKQVKQNKIHPQGIYLEPAVLFPTSQLRIGENKQDYGTSLSILPGPSPHWAGAGVGGLHLGRRTHSDQWLSTLAAHQVHILSNI